MENTQPKEAPKMSGIKKVFLFLIGFLILSFILQMGGVKVMNKTTEDSMIERPHSPRD